MAELAELSTAKEDLLFSVRAALMIGEGRFEKLEHGYKLISPEAGADALPLTCQYAPDSKTRFINPRYRAVKAQNEIRSAAFCFANLEAIAPEMRESAITMLQQLADKYSGFVNKYDDTDKGLTALILFGLPLSEDKTLQRSCLFALEAVGTVPELGLGISCGSVFAGFTGSGEIREYTASGNPVNLANRLMSKARAGEVLTDSFLWQELHAAYDFSYLGSLNLKGIEQPIRYYRLKRLTQLSQREEHRFVGRDEELCQIREMVDQAISTQENTIVYVYGDAGIGKSRLVSEALATYSNASPEPGKSCYKYFITNDAILRKPLEAIKQILRSHFYYNPALPIQAAIPMFRALWSQIDPADSEMQRIESFLASLLGYEWEGSIWSLLPPEERPQQLKNAFVYMIRKLAQSRAILIHLDDGQWLDEESQGYFQALSEAEISPLIIVSPCRYLEDGNKTDLQLGKHRRYDLELDSLSDSGSSALITSIMRLTHLPQDTLELIIDRSMGNPLFIEQLTSYLMETGSLSDKGEIIKELGYLSSFSISDIISSRIDRLTDRVKECLFSASVLGMEFNIKVLSEMLKSDLIQELETGTNSRIWKDLDELRYIFSHILIKDIVYQRMMSDKLKELHKLAAETMEEVYKDKLDENAEEIAIHYERAGLEE
ncbi:MAG TPA: AAA family ATPase, partial [Candidatus Cloacimonadota bacterium]|nr:AAA family ATPase [Candidatus Cloacimonadota bacterium]